MEKPAKEKPKQEANDEPEKITGGLIGVYCEDWEKFLPPGIKKEDAETFSGSDGNCYWKLKPKSREGKEGEKYSREMWET